MELKELRKAIKPLGYKIKTQSLSWGRHATYVHAESGEELTFNVVTSREQMQRWQPLFGYLETIPSGTLLVNNEEKVYGGKFGS